MSAAAPLELAPERGRTTAAPASFYAIVGGNDFYWRLYAPAAAIGAKQFLVPEVGGYYAISFPNDDTPFKWGTRYRFLDGSFAEVHSLEAFKALAGREVVETWGLYPEHQGAAVWTRPDLPRASHAKAMRKNGVFTIAEVDDNYFCPTKQNIFLRGQQWGERERTEHAKACASMDRIVVSTDWLRDRYFKELRARFGKSSVPEIVVCRNHVAQSDWPDPVPREDKVRVGWMGSPSHVWDVDNIWGALMMTKQMGAEPWMVGYDPSNVDLDPTGPHLERARAKAEQWTKVGFRHVPWIDPDKFRRAALPFDIGLAPLLSNDFTAGKSDVKAIEYAISGAAPVLQSTPVYNRDWVHGETCLLAGSDVEFLKCTELLIRDENLRERIVKNAQQYVRESRGLKQLQTEWMAAVT